MVFILLHFVSKPISLDFPHHFINHAASQASSRLYGVDPVETLSANVLGTMQLLELGFSQPVISFMYLSSGETQSVKTKEAEYVYVDPTSVRSCYAQSKGMGTNICVSLYAKFQVLIKIVRPFHTYGPRMKLDDDRFYAIFVRDIVENRAIVIERDFNDSRVFCYQANNTAGFLQYY